MNPNDMISLEQARELVLSKVDLMESEIVPTLQAVGRICAAPRKSDMDVSPFPHSAMDGFAVHADATEGASAEMPVVLSVIAEVGAGDSFDGTIGKGECARIMTGAELPEDADGVVKIEDVELLDKSGMPGGTISISSPVSVGQNVRAAGEEAKAGEVVIDRGDLLKSAGVGYLVGCGVLDLDVFSKPNVSIIATGSELVSPDAKPGPGHIRETNSYTIAACVQAAGGIPHILPIAKDTYEDLASAVKRAAAQSDFVITTGGAANGDFDFIKKVVGSEGELFMTLVNMRPGKAQTFGFVDGTPVFGLPGNPAAAYCGFELIIRPALLKMQGHSHLDHPHIMAKLTQDVRKKDPRRILMRSTFSKDGDGSYSVTPSKNQSSGLFGPIQRSNCMMVMPEGLESKSAGDEVECIILDIPEYVSI